MAQPMLCDEHGEPGILLVNTLVPPVESITLCGECIKPWALQLVGELGMVEPLREQIAAELAQEAKRAAARPAAKKTAGKRTAKPAGDGSGPAPAEDEPAGEGA
jgi:hypothetical protein